MDVNATFRRPDEAVGHLTVMRNATPMRVTDALARLSGRFSVSLWLDETDHFVRVTSIDTGQFTVDVLAGEALWTVTHARAENDIAPLPAEAALVRGVPVVRATQILGVINAVRVAFTWLGDGRLGPQWRLLRL